LFKLSLFPRGEKFFILLEQSAQNTVKIAQQLNDMINVWENIKERIGIISDFEHQGDAITHQIFAQLHRTLITPIDREDIASLTHSLDDITDSIHSTAESILIYDIESPVRGMQEFSEIILQAVMEIERAVSEMHNKIEPKKMLGRCIDINRLENLGDSLYRSSMAELFTFPCDIASLIKWREIYGHMESALDQCENVSNILEGISIKYA
jgi:predicted phosphate transport protein (TIGR00153 family)